MSITLDEFDLLPTDIENIHFLITKQKLHRKPLIIYKKTNTMYNKILNILKNNEIEKNNEIIMQCKLECNKILELHKEHIFTIKLLEYINTIDVNK